MSVDTAAELLHTLRAARLLRPEQLTEAETLAERVPGLRELVRELFRRGWLTKFQLSMVLHGRAGELQLGQYRLLDRLGSGGMGNVYRAIQERLGRVVALKVVRPEMLKNPLVGKRFAREVRAAARLDHPHVVHVYDAEQAGDLHFLVMEFVDGIDLSRRVKEYGPLPVRQACAYAREAALGLQHIHDAGLVHRDVKPSNLLMDSHGAIKVLDLGLARARQTDEPQDTELTRADTVLGTPDFMAPEQARDSRTVDARADVYSLGAALFFLLTGRVPFPGGSAVEKLIRHQTEAPPPLAGLRPDVPPGLDELLARLLAKKPKDRYPTAAAAAEALAPFGAGAPVEAPPPPPEESPFIFDETPAPILPTVALARKTRSRRPSYTAYAVGGLLVVVALAAAVALTLRRSPGETKAAGPELANKSSSTTRPTHRESGPTPKQIEPWSRYLPDDTGLVAVLNVEQLAHSPAAHKHLLPALRPALDQFALLHLDPAKTFARCVLALNRHDPRRRVVFFQYPFLNPDTAEAIDRAWPKESLEVAGHRHELSRIDRAGQPPVYLATLSDTCLALADHKDDLREALLRVGERRPKLPEPAWLQPAERVNPEQTTLWVMVHGQQAGEDGQVPLEKAGLFGLLLQARLTDRLDVEVELFGPGPKPLEQFEGMAAKGLRLVAASDKRWVILEELLANRRSSEVRGGPAGVVARRQITSRVEPARLDALLAELVKPAK